MNPHGGGFGVTNILVMAVFFVAIYFFMIRPSAKRKKQEDEMRRSLRVLKMVLRVLLLKRVQIEIS